MNRYESAKGLVIDSCPFCDGQAQVTSDGGCKDFCVFCTRCPAQLRIYGQGSEEEVMNLKKMTIPVRKQKYSNAFIMMGLL